MKEGYNKILERQLKKYLNDEEIPSEMLPLFNNISDSYDKFEMDQKLVDRVMDMSSDELMASNLELEKVRFRCNDQLVQLDFAHVKVNLLGATIHHTRDLALIAEYSCVLFPYAPSWGAAQ